MSLLANPTAIASTGRTRSVTRVRTKDQASAAPCGVDLAGCVWTHPNPLHLYHWIERRNELLRTLAGAPRMVN